MPNNLLVLALLAGFCFIHLCDRFRFRAQMLDGYRLLFHCSIAGAGCLFLSRILILFLKLFPLFWTFLPAWHQFSEVPYLGTFSLSIPISVVAAFGWNVFVNSEKQREKEIHDHGDYFTSLLLEAVKGNRMVSITLESRKWYAGWVAEAPNLKPNEKYFRLLPVLSGYRDKDTLDARRTINYEKQYEEDGIDPEDFILTLPIQSVRSANLFDPAVYEDHFADSN